MNDILGRLYNGFLLRDILGYVVPGSFVLVCLLHLSSILLGMTFAETVKLIPREGVVYFFVICLCYVCGHFLSGLFFHTRLFNWIFKYSPEQMTEDYPQLDENSAWTKHRSEYRKACDVTGNSVQSHIERHAALVHFTGHVSTSLIFTVVYVVFLAIYYKSFGELTKAIPMLVILPGVFSHYRRLSLERYLLEMDAIASSKIEKETPTKDEST